MGRKRVDPVNSHEVPSVYIFIQIKHIRASFQQIAKLVYVEIAETHHPPKASTNRTELLQSSITQQHSAVNFHTHG